MEGNNNAEVATNGDATNLSNYDPRFKLSFWEGTHIRGLWPNSEDFGHFMQIKSFERMIKELQKEYKELVSRNIMSKLQHRKVNGSQIVPNYEHRWRLHRLAEAICRSWNKNTNIQVRQRMLEFGQVKWDINLSSLPICHAYDVLSNN